MAKRMLIDATHPEETRVVVVNGNRLEEFDFESSTKQQVKGNIYLAKVTRVEPSLQAAFVEYGGNRHGFLAFSEIHPDYFRIPVGDRDWAGGELPHADPGAAETLGEPAEDVGVPLAAALPEPVVVVAAPGGDDTALEDAVVSPPESADPADHSAPGEDDADEPAAAWRPPAETLTPAESPIREPISGDFGGGEFGGGKRDGGDTDAAPGTGSPDAWPPVVADEAADSEARDCAETGAGTTIEDATADFAAQQDGPPWSVPGAVEVSAAAPEPEEGSVAATPDPGEPIGSDPIGYAALRTADAVIETPAPIDWAAPPDPAPEAAEGLATEPAGSAALRGDSGETEIIETIGGDEFDDAERQRSRAPRHYKIQEVIKRRQIMLVQVTKEERGNKGAALTTYLSLAGRYCVLMPNTARGGGVSRKITSITDRRRLKDILEELDIPDGMGVIVRTAGAERSKAEIKRDYEYLLRLWNEIRELTLQSTAPAVIYEEGNLIKRSIRDLYTRDIDEVLVEGEDGYRTAKSFMKMLMPSHAKRVQPYRDPQIGLLHRFQVESQIDAIHSPIVQLRSGGYIVINQTEALVAIDVNSGRSTRERNIEETALRTNLEAAEEIARQLRLRDLAGLIVIDFIDMEEHRNQGAVERRLKDALKNERARIQVGRISPFGLLEMSRQRLRPSLVEASTQPCPHCGGTGFIRSTESTALYVLRSIEEEGMRRRSAEVCVYVPTTVALYILNHKRDSLAQLETRYGVHVLVARDDALIPPAFRLERLRAYEPGELPPAAPLPLTQAVETEIEEPDEEDDGDSVTGTAEQRPQDDEERGRARRRRRRRRRHEDERGTTAAARSAADGEEPDGEAVEPSEAVEPGDVAAGAASAGKSHDAETSTEDDKLRRRRGRRGGRRRGRREEGGEPSFDDPRLVSETIEVALPAGPDGPDLADAATAAPPQTAAPVTAPWPVATDSGAGFDPVVPVVVPTPTGEAWPSHASAPASEPDAPEGAALPRPETAQTAHEAGVAAADTAVEATPEPPAETLESSHTAAETMAPETMAPEMPAAEATAADMPAAALAEPESGHRLAAMPAAPEPLAEPEALQLAEPQSQPEPAQSVLTVTEKPPSPRKGWWQRLIQS